MDARAQQAREHHRAAGNLDDEAARRRGMRDQIVRQLRTEDPRYWTFRRLAAEVGCSFKLIGDIVNGNEDATKPVTLHVCNLVREGGDMEQGSTPGTTRSRNGLPEFTGYVYQGLGYDQFTAGKAGRPKDKPAAEAESAEDNDNCAERGE